MRRLPFIILLASVVMLGACEKTVDSEQTFTIRLNDCKSPVISGDDIQLCFNELIEDSRCPSDVVCIWSGVAVGDFTFTKNGEAFLLKLATINGTDYFKEVIINGYKIELIDIYPYPRTTEHPPLAEIKAKVKITKL